MSVSGLNEWRRTQVGMLSGMQISDQKKYNRNASSEFEANIDEALKEYLANNGVGEDSDNYNEVFDTYRRASIDQISESNWHIRGSLGSGDPRPQSVVFAEEIQTRFGNQIDADPDVDTNPDTDDNPDTVDDSAEQQRIERLAELRKAKHDAYVQKIRGPRFGERSRQATADYRAAEAEYVQALNEDIRLHLERELGDDLTEDRRAQAIQQLGDEVLREDANAEHQLLMERGGTMARILSKYDKMSLWKKLGIGAGIAGVGIAGGAIAGAVGAGAAVIAGGVAGYRMTTSYVNSRILSRARIYREPSSTTGFTFDRARDAATPEEQITARMTERASYNIEQTDKAKKRAVIIGVGSAALAAAGGVAGTLVHINLVDMPDTGTKTGNLLRKPQVAGNHWRGGYIEHIGGDVNSDSTSVAIPEVDIDPDSPEADPKLPLPPSMRELSDPLPTSEQGPMPLTVDTEVDAPAVAAEAPADADVDLALGEDQVFAAELQIPTYTVAPGEGWYTTFDNLGVNNDYSAQLLDQVGPELVDMGVATPHGDSYWITNSGELPHDATELIMTTAHDNGWLIATSPEIEVGLPVVDHGEGLNSFVNSHYDHTLTPQESLELGERLHEQGYMYESMYLEQNYGNPYGINEPGRIDATFDATIREYLGIDAPTTDVVTDVPGTTGLQAGAELGGLDTVADTTTVESQPMGELVTTTDDAGVDVDDESLRPSGEQTTVDQDQPAAEADAEKDVDTESTPEADVSTDGVEPLNQFAVGPANAAIEANINSGEYSRLNNIEGLPDSVDLHLDTLAANLQGMTYSDGTTRLVDFESGSSFSFNDQPAGARLPNEAVDVINAHLEALGLNTYSYDTFNRAAFDRDA